MHLLTYKMDCLYYIVYLTNTIQFVKHRDILGKTVKSFKDTSFKYKSSDNV